MNRLFFSFFTLLMTQAAVAQLNGNGYYRVQNVKSTRYITVQDNRGSVDVQSTSADMQAIKTIRDFENVVNDPASVIYFQQVGTTNGVEQYNLYSQGTDTKVITGGRYLSIRETQNGYLAYGSAAGMTIYLADEESILPEPPEVGSLVQNGTTAYRYWNILPLDQSDNQYFGLKPEVTVGTSKYTSLYASFPFTFYSSGMKAYTVTTVDGGMAVWQELTGTVPASTPVIILCAGDDASSNRLNIVNASTTAPADNLLKGVYFCNGNPGDDHFNKTTNDPNTMRFLGVTGQGRLGFVKSSEEYVPRNRAYLVVPEGSPDEITLMTQAEYEEEKKKDDVVVTANSYTRVYGDPNPVFDYTSTGYELKGTPELTCNATELSPVGVYDIVVSRGSVTNVNATFVNGTLTITPAQLTISAGDYTIKQNEPLPQFVASYAGFKVGDDASSLTSQPVLTTDAPADKTPGVYSVIVSGAASDNYDITYTAGTLTILEADAIIIVAQNAEMTYGDELPAFSYQVEGGELSGQPVISCEASSQSSVGTYAIHLELGSITYPNVHLVDGELTVTKAPLTVSVGDYVREQGQSNPEFVLQYDGFRNGDTESVLTEQPVATTEATPESGPGLYDIVLSGGSALNYYFEYQSGHLTITAQNAISTVTLDHPVDVYNLSGNKVLSRATTLAVLPKGVYIVEGRKIVVR